MRAAGTPYSAEAAAIAASMVGRGDRNKPVPGLLRQPVLRKQTNTS